MALSGLRSVAGTLGGKIILGVIAFTFVTWGASSAFINAGNRAVAVVGGEEIDIDDYQAEYERTLQRISNERGGRLSVTQAKQEQIPQGVLANMVVRQAIVNHANSLGVTTSDAEAIKQIKEIDAFNGILNEFDEATFVIVLQQSGFTRPQFEATVRTDIVREQMVGAVVSGMALPRGMAEVIVRSRLERRNASYIVLAPDLAGQIDAPSEEVLRTYYEDRIFNYTADEYRDISFINMTSEDFTTGIAIPEEELQDLYDRRVTVYTKPESRSIERLFGSEQDMNAAKARIEAGESFTSIGASLGLEADDVVLGDIDEKAITDTAVARAAFEVTEPGLIGPIEGLSWSLLRVNSIKAASVTPFAEVRAELREELIDREANRVLSDNIDIVDEAIASGDPLEAIAKSIGLPLHSIKKVNSSGELESGGKPTTMPDDPDFLEEVYASVKNFDSDLVEYGDGNFFVVRVDEIYPSAPKAFEAVRDEVERSWLNMERGNRLVTLAATIIERAEAGEDFAKLGNEVGRGVLQVPGGVGRTQTTDLLSQALVGKLFTASEGDYFYSRVELGESLVVMQAGSVIAVPDEQIADLVDGFKAQLDASFAGDAERQYLNAVRQMYTAKENPDAIALAIGDAPLQQSPF